MSTEEVDGLCLCPYNQSHLIQPHKLPNHLLKCRKNNPALAQHIVICPYNQCHHVPTVDLEAHFRKCKEYHNFQAISIKPATRIGLPHRPKHSTDMLEQEQMLYNSHRDKFTRPPPTDDPAQAKVQAQRNLDDLDEWFVE